jgi:endonuclease/exonuclease/phosphatase (EEP) superfamily protein YafD
LSLSAVFVLGAGRAVAQDVDDALAIEVDLPSTLSCGQSYQALVTMQNTGTTTWTEAEGYRLGAVDDGDDLFGPGRVFLPDGVTVAPGESYTFTLTLTAPTTGGWYRTDWRMLREYVAWFGEMAARDVHVECPPPGVDDAMVIEADLPSTLSCGQSYRASVTMQNTGTTTWTEAEAIRLGAIGNSDDLGGPGRIYLPAGLSVLPNEGYTFTMTLTAPTTPGTYVTDWRMLREGVAWFGQAVARDVQVDCLPPGVDDAMVIEADLPSTLSCGQSYRASVTMQNTGSTTWTEGEAIRLGAVGNSDDLGGPVRFYLPAGLSVLPGESYTFTMMLTAPTTPGVYLTDWQMLRESVAWFGQVAAQNVAVSCEPAYNGARIVSVSRPDLMAPGGSAEVSVTVENTGSTTWDPASYFLGAVNDEMAWGLNRVPLDQPVAPGNQTVFTFSITAPSTTGLYDFHWRMVQEPVEWFGESTGDQQIFVWGGFNSAGFVSQSGVPANLVAGQTAMVSVTMENTGTTVWEPSADYFLGSINPYNNQVWGVARVSLDHPVQPLERTTFTFMITAPSMPGPHHFQWQMVQELVEWFGTPTPDSIIVVGSPDDMAVPVGHTIPESMSSGTLYLVTVTMENTGSSIWTRDGDGPPDGSRGYKLAVKSGALIPVGTRIPMTFGDEVEPGEAYTFVTVLVPPEGLSFASAEFQMIHEGLGWFGESLRVGVAIDGAEGGCTVNLDPPSGPPGTLVTVTPAACTFDPRSRLAFSFGDPQQHGYSLVPVSYTLLGPMQIDFLVPSDADCGSHYVTVRQRRLARRQRRLDPTPPAEFNVTGPCDSSRRNSFDVLSYNVHLLPILDDSDGYRAGLIATHPDLKGHDAIVFVEAIDDNRWVLINRLRQDYPYVTPVITSAAHPDNGGVFIMSKWPIDAQWQHVFEHCHGDLPTNPPDCRAAKGVNYARINKAGQPYHLLGTHFDAGFESGDYFARQLQTDEMAALYFGAQAEQPVIMAGDFNIDKVSRDPARQVEYAYLLDTLRVTAPSDPPYPPNQGTNPKGEWIDFVFYSNAHLVPRESFNYVVKPRDAGGGDLSDHYAVLGRFRFLPP